MSPDMPYIGDVLLKENIKNFWMFYLKYIRFPRDSDTYVMLCSKNP